MTKNRPNESKTMEYLFKCLDNMYRICSNRVLACLQKDKRQVSRLCVNSKNEIFIFYGIDVTSDTEIHPQKICTHCFFKMKNAKVLCENTKLDNAKYLGVKERAKRERARAFLTSGSATSDLIVKFASNTILYLAKDAKKATSKGKTKK